MNAITSAEAGQPVVNQEHTRDRIMWTAARLVADGGYGAASMRDIASSVGIKAASVYNHFKGKDAVLDGILDSAESAVQRFSVEEKDFPAEARRLPTEELLHHQLRRVLGFWEQDREGLLLRVLWMERFHLSRASTILASVRRVVFARIGWVIAELVQLGKLRDTDERAAALLLTHVCSDLLYARAGLRHSANGQDEHISSLEDVAMVFTQAMQEDPGGQLRLF